MAKLYDLAVKTGSYTNDQNEEKNRYQNIGAVMESNNGKFILLYKWFNPAGIPDERGGDSIVVSMFKPKPRQNQQAQPAPNVTAPAVSTTATAAGFDDDIPF
jgi:hypothetical protein